MFAARPMTTYRALELGATPAEIGVMTSLFALAPLLLAVPVGRAVDGQAAITYLRGGGLCLLSGCVVLTVGPTVAVLTVGNVVAGVGVLLTAVAAQGRIARGAPFRGHDHAFGWLAVAASAGQLVGPLIAGSVVQHGGGSARAGLWSASAFAVAGACAVLPGGRRTSTRVRPARAQAGPESVPRLLARRGMPAAMLTSVSVLACVDLLTAFLPMLAEHRGMSAQAVGWLLAIRAGASLGSRLLVATLADRWGRTRVLLVSSGAAAAAVAMLPVVPAMFLLVVIMMVAGFALGIGQPLTMSWVAGLAPPSSRATAMAVRLAGNRAGQLTVPAAAGLAAGIGGVTAVYMLAAALLTSAGIGIALTDRRL